MQATPKILLLLLIMVLVQQSASVTFKQYNDKKNDCRKNITIDSCMTNPLSEYPYGKVDPDGCALDYYRSMACFNAFSKCTYVNQNDEIPVHCWNCLVQSQADSDIFKMYQNCLNQNSSAYHTVGVSLAIALLLALFVM